MPEFKFYVDRQVTCVERQIIEIPAESLKEAVKLIKEAVDYEVDIIESEREIIYETIKQTISRVDGRPILTISTDGNVIVYRNE